MNRNTESHFSNVPQVNISRSKFDRSQDIKSSWNIGELVPFYIEEVLAGDSYKIQTNKIVRLSTLITPVMDNVYLDTYYYYCPFRILWKHWPELMGQNSESPWTPTTEYSVPQITPPSNGWDVGTLADYFGLVTGVDNYSVTQLPFRAYCAIVNEFFRDENLQDPLNWSDDDTDIAGVNTGTFVTDCVKGGKPFIAAKFHDYFTSALPEPQKGPDVPLPLGSLAPVITGSDHITIGDKFAPLKVAYGSSSDTEVTATGNSFINASQISGKTAFIMDDNLGFASLSNMYADLANATGTSVSQLRQAFQIQKLYERDARAGTRYREILKGHFGVTAPDSRVMIPEFIGGNRIRLNVKQVVSSSETSRTVGEVTSYQPLGTTAAMSVTGDSHYDVDKSFVEPGIIIGLMVARYDHTYSQGINRFWSRKKRFDFYWPVLQNLSEQAIKNKEIYVQGSDVINPDTGKAYDEEVFGYQEAWADYRYKPNQITGMMRSSYSASLDVWHFGDDYNSLPTLSDSWIREDKSNVDRTLAVTSSVSNQIIADIQVKVTATRPMPVYSIPGLIDHN